MIFKVNWQLKRQDHRYPTVRGLKASCSWHSYWLKYCFRSVSHFQRSVSPVTRIPEELRISSTLSRKGFFHSIFLMTWMIMVIPLQCIWFDCPYNIVYKNKHANLESCLWYLSKRRVGLCWSWWPPVPCLLSLKAEPPKCSQTSQH